MLSVGYRQIVGLDDKSVGTCPPYRGECADELVRVSHLRRMDRNPQGSRCELYFPEIALRGGIEWIPKIAKARSPGDSLLQQLEPLSYDVARHPGQSGDVSSGARQAVDKTAANRVAGSDHDDGYRTRCLLEGENLGCTGRYQDIGLGADQFAGDFRKEIWPLRRVPAQLNLDILTLDITPVAKPLTECLDRLQCPPFGPVLTKPIRGTRVGCCAWDGAEGRRIARTRIATLSACRVIGSPCLPKQALTARSRRRAHSSYQID